MNCRQVQNLLSAYYDGELPDDQVAAIADHLAECTACASQLAEFGQLTAQAQRLHEPRAPTAAIWTEVRKQLDGRREVIPARWRLDWLRPRARPLVAVAASLLVAAFATGIWFWNTSRLEYDHLAANFDAYLDEFPIAPDQAQQVLLVNYAGREVTLDQATRTLGYTPLAGAKAPQGYAIENVYLLEMPCCKCAQIVYRSPAGRQIAIFEHDLDQPKWFGERPAIACRCNGKPAKLVQINGRYLAATCKMGQRYVTLIGAQDVEEVKLLMAELMRSSTAI